MRTRWPLIVDYRKGSGPFADPLKRMGYPVKVRTLGSADFSFLGNGRQGLAYIGIERKTVSEVVAALTGDKRFRGKQFPAMLESYDYSYLIIEGNARPDRRSGLLMSGQYEAGHGPRAVMYGSYKKFLNTLAVKGRVFLEPTFGFEETLWTVAAIYEWYQKSWASHHSAFEVEETQPDALIFTERTMKRQIAAQLPGVGWARSRQVSEAFPSVKAMINATEAEWRAALGIAKGKKIAKRLVEVLSAK